MRKLTYVILCLSGMFCVWAFARFMVYGINDQFGVGFGAGCLTITLLNALHAHVFKARPDRPVEVNATALTARRRA